MGRNGKERPLSLVLHHRGLCWIVRLDPSNRCNVEQVHGNKPYTECHDMSCITVSILLFTKNVNYTVGTCVLGLFGSPVTRMKYWHFVFLQSTDTFRRVASR